MNSDMKGGICSPSRRRSVSPESIVVWFSCWVNGGNNSDGGQDGFLVLIIYITANRVRVAHAVLLFKSMAIYST